MDSDSKRMVILLAQSLQICWTQYFQNLWGLREERLRKIGSSSATIRRAVLEDYLSPGSSINEPRGKLRLRDLLDISPTLTEAAGAIVDDSFTRCFKSNPPEPWNWNIYLFPLWCFGVVVRYCILFPLRCMTLAMAINAGDRVDSALKDMAIVMKQKDRAEEAIEAIKSLRVRCSDQAQESLDNILLDLYKRCGRLDDQIALLKHKLFLIQKGLAFKGKRTKTARSQGKKFQVSVEQEATRLLGNLGWALMQRENFVEAEDAYRRALSIAPDNNKMCNLGICLMKQGRIDEAKETLRRVKPAVTDGPRGVDSHLKAYERAQQMLNDLGSEMMRRGGDDKVEQRRLFEAMFGSSSIWQPQPCREQSMKPKPKLDLSIDGYGDENVKTNVGDENVKTNVNMNVVVNPLRVDAKPFFSSKLISNNEKLKRRG